MAIVSVIVPVYNAEKYVTRCIESVISQNYEDFELILINDGSTDNSKQICESYCSLDGRIKLYNQGNKGPDIARKLGVSKASGKWVMFLDADDYVDENAIKCMMKETNDSVDIVCAQIERFDDNGHFWKETKASDSIIEINSHEEAMRAFFDEKKLVGTYYAKLIRYEIIVGYSFVEESIIGEDITAALYMFKKARKIIIIPDRVYFYFWNLESISHSGYSKRHKISLLNYIKVRDEVLEYGYVDIPYVCGFFAEYEMAVATAMSRNHFFDKEAIKILRNDLKKYWKHIKSNKRTAVYMKICIKLFILCPMFFMFLYRVIYLITGR